MKKFNKLSLSLTVIALLFAFTNFAQVTESFTDGNFTVNPIWSGDTGNWTIKNNSSAGAGAPGAKTLRLDAPVGMPADVQYLSTPYSNWGTSQTWGFFIGRRGKVYSNSNKVYIWLYANEANLESTTIDGYRIRIGQTGDDEIRLEKVTDGVGTIILASPAITASKDFGVDIVIERTVTGGWTMKTSSLPTMDSTGATADLDPITTAVINHGSVIDNTYTPSGSGFVGIVGHHGTGNATKRAIEFDQFSLSVSSNSTHVEYSPPFNSYHSENEGVVNIPISILYESITTATTVDVVLISGDAARVNNYTTQTVTFPAGNGSIQFLPVTITDNSLCDGNEELVFQLQNITGGSTPSIGIYDTHNFTILDNENGSVILKEDNLEDEELDLWDQSGSSSWEITGTGAISDFFSLRHVFNGSAGVSSISTPINNGSLRSVTTSWQFNFNHFGNNPTPNNNFLMYLAANESDLTSSTVDGYAVGVRPATSGDPDIITLWKVVDGVTTTPIVTSTYDLGSTDYEIGVRIVRDDFGVWELLIDDNGGFDNLLSKGTGSNTDYINADYFGVYFKYASSRGGKLAIDDLVIEQEGCSYTYYTQLSGDVDGPIWSDAPVGAPAIVKFNRFTTLNVQAGHSVNMNVGIDAKDLIILPNGSWDAGIEKMSIYGNFYNDGMFIPSTSKFFLCGSNTQEIGGINTTKFYDLTMNNIGGDVLQAGDVEMINVYSPVSGEYDTDGYFFTLLSDASNTGSIGTFGTSDFYGEITMQRYIPADVVPDGYPGGWVRIGNSLDNSTLNSWNDNLITTGFTGADYEYVDYPFVNIYTYDETDVTAGGAGWIPATNINNTLSTTQGYAVYMLGEAQSIDVKGDFQRGSITHNLDYTNTGDAVNDGWNLVVNQYPSEIDFNEMYNYSNGITSYSVWDTETSSYLVYNASTGMGTGSRYVPSSQPMWIQATASGQYLQYEEDIKSNTGVSFERDNSTINQLEISINQDIYQDRTFLGFATDATNDFDVNYDLRKIDKTPAEEGLPLTISSVAANENMSINVLPEISQNTSIPLFISVGSAGEVSIVIENTLGLPESSCMILEDLVLNETHQLIQGESFSFMVDEPYEGNRFLIHLGAPIEIAKTDISCYGDTNGQITAQGQGEGPFDYTWYDENDVIIHQESNISGSSTISELPLGNYIVEVASTNGLCGTVNEMVYIDQPQEQNISWSIEPDYCHQNNPGIIVIETNTNSAFDYEIRDENDQIILQGTSEETLVEEFETGVYQVSVSTSCNLYQFQADLVDPEFVSVEIEESETYLNINNGESTINFNANFSDFGTITWTIGGEIVSTDESFNYTFNEVGDYYVLAIIENDNGCYATDEQIVHVTNTVEIEEFINTNASMIQYENKIDLSFDHTIGKAQLEIINFLGQVIITRPISIDENVVVSENISSLSNAAYIIRVKTENDMIFARKFIK